MACVPVFMVVVMALEPHFARFLVKSLGLGFLAFLFFTTVEQNIYARSELAMMERSLHFQPENARLQASAGMAYAMAEKFPEAEAHFRAAVAAEPFNARYSISLGKSICDQGRYQECLVVYDSIKDPGSFAGLLEQNRKAALQLQIQNP